MKRIFNIEVSWKNAGIFSLAIVAGMAIVAVARHSGQSLPGTQEGSVAGLTETARSTDCRSPLSTAQLRDLEPRIDAAYEAAHHTANTTFTVEESTIVQTTEGGDQVLKFKMRWTDIDHTSDLTNYVTYKRTCGPNEQLVILDDIGNPVG